MMYSNVEDVGGNGLCQSSTGVVHNDIFFILGLLFNPATDRSLVRCFIKLIIFFKFQDRFFLENVNGKLLLTFGTWTIFGSLNKCLG